MKTGKHRKHDRSFLRRWLGKTPIGWIWRLWNPFKIVDKKNRIIGDIFAHRRAKKISRSEREKRKLTGEGEKRWFSCKLTRSLDFSGDAD